MASSKVTRAINAFEKAVKNKAFEGAIPVHSEDSDEQLRLDAIHSVIQHNYVKARAKLERLMENV